MSSTVRRSRKMASYAPQIQIQLGDLIEMSARSIEVPQAMRNTGYSRLGIIPAPRVPNLRTPRCDLVLNIFEFV
jgi:hypothetical protein